MKIDHYFRNKIAQFESVVQAEPSPRQCDPIREEDPKESSPETESASESDRLAAQEDDEEDMEASPLLRLSESRMR
ncbi:hypothetical protein TNCV_4842781 [Trichonephila clavipes]|uniref:Uncharacterized protein n=1 Tax=Trichonephila clavipes TaxID=2585209 RepID=A0A8X6WLF8_TRICX|nr:hypothetical protein TNCV_4842781 [Trichonephila clavipes]